MKKRGAALVFAAFAVACMACSDTGAPVQDEGYPPPDYFTIRPAGFPEMKSPADNPLSRQGVALGRRLFYEPLLSRDSTMSCGSCHRQESAFGDPRVASIGIHGDRGTRNASTIINPGWQPVEFWDGRAASLEAQATEPVPNPTEMDLTWDDAVARLRSTPPYPQLFGEAFGDETITADRVVRAIAQFERTFVSTDSKFDRVQRGEATFTDAEQRGHDLFFSESGDCFHCHQTVFNSDFQFHNIGLDSLAVDEGLGDITSNPLDVGKFKTPSLRNIAVSAPYMHDGRFATLEEVIDHYNRDFAENSPNLDPLISVRTKGRLSPSDIQDLIAFLNTLTDPAFLTDPGLSNPFTTP